MKLLKNDSDAPSGFAQRGAFKVGQVAAIDQNSSGIRFLNAADAAKKGTLPCPAETDDAVNGARLYAQVHVRERLNSLAVMQVTLADAFERDYGRDGLQSGRIRHAQKDGDTAPL